MKDFRDFPIPMAVLPWTNREDGDDAGYRQVPVSSSDLEAPDPLVPLAAGIGRHIVYARGAAPRITSAYGTGLGAPDAAFVRAPVNACLFRLDAVLKSYGWGTLVVDAFRLTETQRRLFAYLMNVELQRRKPQDLLGFIQAGLAADDIGAYAAIEKNASYRYAFDSRYVNRYGEFNYAAIELDKTIDETIELDVTFRANLGLEAGLTLDRTSTTAHGTGGATDIVPYDLVTGEPVFGGTPFDWQGSASAMRYFEDMDNLESYAKLAESDPVLKQYLRDFGIERATEDTFLEAQRNRRLFYHACRRVGATHFFLEWWHFNWGNENGGRRFVHFPYAGSGCHSLLNGVFNPTRPQEFVAVWGNAYAQAKADELLGVAK